MRLFLIQFYSRFAYFWHIFIYLQSEYSAIAFKYVKVLHTTQCISDQLIQIEHIFSFPLNFLNASIFGWLACAMAMALQSRFSQNQLKFNEMSFHGSFIEFSLIELENSSHLYVISVHCFRGNAFSDIVKTWLFRIFGKWYEWYEKIPLNSQYNVRL